MFRFLKRNRFRNKVIVNAFYFHDEVIPEPTCAEETFYEPVEDDDYDYFLRYIMRNKNILEPIFHECVDNAEVLVFYGEKLKKLLPHITCKKAIEKCEDIIAGKARHCCRCGSIILDKYFYVYRNNCGCVGRSYECCVCRGLSDSEVHRISEYARKHGTKKTLLKALYNSL